MTGTLNTQDDPLLVKRRCKLCGRNYVLGSETSIGKLHCREHASQFLIRHGNQYMWPCCGAKSQSPTPHSFYDGPYHDSLRGCIPCDHKDDSFVPYCMRDSPDKSKPYREYQEGDPFIFIDKEVIDRNYINPKKEQAEKVTDLRVLVYFYDRKALAEIRSARSKSAAV